MKCSEIKIENNDCNTSYEFQICENCNEIVRNHDGRVIWNFIVEYGLNLQKERKDK